MEFVDETSSALLKFPIGTNSFADASKNIHTIDKDSDDNTSQHSESSNSNSDSSEPPFYQGNWKLIGNCDCCGNNLLEEKKDNDGSVDCGNIHNAITRGQQLIRNGKCGGFVVSANGKLYPKVKMQNMCNVGGEFWSFINVSQNANGYIFELGIDYEGNDLPDMPIRKSYAQKEIDNTVSINDVLAELETRRNHRNKHKNKHCTNFAVYGSDYENDNKNCKNCIWFKDPKKVPGVYHKTKSNKHVASSSLANGPNVRLSIKYVQ